MGVITIRGLTPIGGTGYSFWTLHGPSATGRIGCVWIILPESLLLVLAPQVIMSFKLPVNG